MIEFKDLLGKTLTEIDIDRYNGNDTITFRCNDETAYQLYHLQDCCESVTIDDIVGDLEDLIGNPITLAEESISNDLESYGTESYTWTFYRLATVKGYVDIKWFGESNGYYSESVDFRQL